MDIAICDIQNCDTVNAMARIATSIQRKKETEMTNLEFEELCRAASLALGMEDTGKLAHEGRIEIDDVAIGFFFNEKLNDGKMHCYVDLGAFEPADRTDVYGELLAMNLFTGSKTSAVFAIDPGTSHALMVSQLLASAKLTGENLADIFKAYAQLARKLRAGLLHGADDMPLFDVAACAENFA